MKGWVKINRRLIDWQWYQNSNMLHLFIHLILKANHADGKWQSVAIKRGQLVTGRKKLSAETGISEPIIRKCLSRLKRSGEIFMKRTNRYSIVTIYKYDFYQSEFLETSQQEYQRKANKRPSKSHKQECK